jgi:2,4-dienoyl-CoA reductase-like NADH-dependent reductase (Old Yellow Enzyme family)
MSSILFEPYQLAGIRLKNRFVRSATAEAMATEDGRPTVELKALYNKLADGGVGLLITSGAMIESWPRLPSSIGVRSPLCIYDDSFIHDWRTVIDVVHASGTKIAMQLGHLGRQDIPALRGSAPLAPSVVPIESSGETPQRITQAEIDDVVEKFAQASRRAQAAGFDAVQFHGAHGNIITNFMSPFSNRRSDGYGGSPQNRARFLVEIVQRTRSLVGKDMPLLIKLSFSDFIKGGLTLEDAVQIAALAVDAGLDGIEVSGGTLSDTPEQIAVKHIRTEDQEAYFQPFSEVLKSRVQVPVILVGGLRTPRVMEQVLREGAADLVAMSRPVIREPDLIKRWQGGDRQKATCISCNQCFINWISQPTRCYVDRPKQK